MLLWNGRQPSCLLGPDAGKRHLVIELSWACWINSCLSNDFRWTARNTEKENRSHCIFPFPKKTLEPRDFSTSVLRHVGLDTSSLLRVWSCILPDICQYLWPLPRAPPPPLWWAGMSPEIDKCHLEGQNHSSIEPLFYISVFLKFQAA